MNISVFIPKEDDIINDFLEFCYENFNILNIFNNENVYDNNKYDDNNHFYISFLNPYIIKDDRIIKKSCINFHPSTPKYRGVCGCSLALYNNDEYYGVTSHYINNKIDDGNIIDVSYFKIPDNINCLDLNYITKKESLNLCKKVLKNIKLNNSLPKINKQFSWGNILMTRKIFKEWMIIDLEKINCVDEIKNKIRACINDQSDGPFLKLNNCIYSIKNM